MSEDGMRIALDAGNWLGPALMAALVLALVATLYRRTFPPVSTGRRILLPACRVAALWLLVVFLVDPSLVSTRTGRKAPLVVALLDVSRSMGIADAGERTRLEAALDALESFREAIESVADADVRVYPFAGTLGDSALTPSERPGAGGEGTNIVGAIGDVLARHRGRPPAAVVLLSDGRITRGMTKPAGGLSVPVFAVPFGETREPPDAAIQRIDADRIVYRGTRATIEATVSIAGFPGAETTVLLLDGDRRLAGTTVRGDGTIPVDLTWMPRREGLRRLLVRVGPLSGEERLQNNEEEIAVDVRRSGIRVLLVDQFVDWNATLLRRLGNASPRLDVSVAAGTPEHGYRLIGGGDAEWTVGALDAYDVLLLSDDDEIMSDRTAVQVIESWTDRGGGIAFIADERSPLLRRGLVAEGFLPVKRVGPTRIETGDDAVSSSPAAATAFPLAFEEVVSRTDPPPLSLRIGGLAPAADASTPLVFESDGGPFLSMHRVGDGRVAVVSGYPVWRWALDGEWGASVYEAFFGGLIQLLAGNGEPAFEVRSTRSAWAAGEAIRLSAKANGGPPLDAVRGILARVAAQGNADTVAVFAFSPVQGKRGRFEALLDPLPPGEYRVIASRLGGGRSIESDAVFRVRPVSVEFFRVASDPGVLARVAEQAGGSLIRPGDIGDLPRRMSLEETLVTRRESRSLRDGLPLFLLVVLLLGTEWSLRKAWGLV